MIRVAALLVVVSLMSLLAMLADTHAGTAIAFAFLGMPALGLGMAVYAYHIWRPVRMTKDEQSLYRLAFDTLRARDFVDLLTLGTWEASDAGDTLIRRGDPGDVIRVLLSGAVSFRVEGTEVGTVGPGQLVGASFVVEESVAWGDGVVTENALYFAWPVASLRRALEKKPALRAAIQAIVSRDLAEKVRTLSQGNSTEPS